MRKQKLKEKKPRKKRSDARAPHDPRQRTVRDILMNKVRNGDVRAMTVLGVYYAYGIGGRRLQHYAARLLKNAYSLTNESNPTYRSRADICSMAGKIVERFALKTVSWSFAKEIKAWQERQCAIERRCAVEGPLDNDLLMLDL